MQPQVDTMAKLSCAVCCDETTAFVKCDSCQFQTCVSCAQRYLLESTRDRMDCMSCHAVWNREKLVEAFPKKWVSGTWKEHRENLLYERERGMMPATQLHLAQQVEREQVKQHLKELVAQRAAVIEEKTALRKLIKKGQLAVDDEHYVEVCTRHRELQYLINELQHQPIARAAPAAPVVPTDPTRLACPCPAEGCLGFVLKASWKCGMCDKAVCRECHEVKGDTHVCKPENVLTAKELAKDSKPCPHCAVPTFRISGCAQMWCVACHKAWNWHSGLPETGVIHNPHYFEWQRQNGGRAPLNREVNRDVFPALYMQMSGVPTRDRETPDIVELTKLNRRATHLMVEERRKLTHRRFEDNMDLRIKLMKHEINDLQFKRQLQQREKKREKFTEYAGVLTDYCARVRELLWKMVVEARRGAVTLADIKIALEAAKGAWDDGHKRLQQVAFRYDAVTPKYFTEDFWKKLGGNHGFY